MEIKLYDKNCKEKGNLEFDKDVLADKVDPHFLHEVVKYYLAAKRAGTSSTKTRAEVNGGGRKPWKQKHTGRARQGSIRSPLWKGGGVVFGPRPRDFSIDIPSKKLKLALKQVIKDKIDNNQVFAFENIDFDKPKTKEFVGMIKNLGLEDKKVLVVFDSYTENLIKSMRNIENIRYVRALDVNAYDFIVSDAIIFNQKAIEIIKNRLASN